MNATIPAIIYNPSQIATYLLPFISKEEKKHPFRTSDSIHALHNRSQQTGKHGTSLGRIVSEILPIPLVRQPCIHRLIG